MVFGLNRVGVKHQFCLHRSCLHLKSTITSPLFGDGRGTRNSPDICVFLTIFLVNNNEHLYICLDQDGGCEATEEGGALLNNTPSSSSLLSCLGIINHTPPHQSSSLPAKKLSKLIEESHPPNLTKPLLNQSPCILL